MKTRCSAKKNIWRSKILAILQIMLTMKFIKVLSATIYLEFVLCPDNMSALTVGPGSTGEME